MQDKSTSFHNCINTNKVSIYLITAVFVSWKSDVQSIINRSLETRPLLQYQVIRQSLEPDKQVQILALHKIKLFEEIEWWKSLTQIDWLNESSLAVKELLTHIGKYFLDVTFAPDDQALGFDSSSVIE